MSQAPSGPPTEEEIWRIARRTTDILTSNLMLNACLFGSAACSLWADIGRVPNDIDVVISNDDYLYSDEEEIKEAIVGEDDRYFLLPSQRRGATHQILYCRLPGWRSEGRRVKVDILIPPTLGLPEVRSVLLDDIPVMPLFDLLVMKTKGWWDHSNSRRADFRAKENDDVADVRALLVCAKMENISYADGADEHSDEEVFLENALFLAREFVSAYGERGRWRALGFPL